MNKTNKELIAERFEAIKDKIGREDKEDAAQELGVHPITIHRYLRGEIAKEPFALELLGYLKSRIAEREKILMD